VGTKVGNWVVILVGSEVIKEAVGEAVGLVLVLVLGLLLGLSVVDAQVGNEVVGSQVVVAAVGDAVGLVLWPSLGERVGDIVRHSPSSMICSADPENKKFPSLYLRHSVLSVAV